MFVWQRSIVGFDGDILPGALVEVRLVSDNTLAAIFADIDGVTPKSNPFLADSEGFARFYADADLYRITATDTGFERTLEDVLLGVRVEDVPDLTSLVTPIVESIIDPLLEELADQIAAFPELVRFGVDANGTPIGSIPSGFSTARTGVGAYTIVTNRATTFYNPKLQIWDPGTDRVYSAMLKTKDANQFTYQVRSIHDVASNSDARVDIEITFPGA